MSEILLTKQGNNSSCKTANQINYIYVYYLLKQIFKYLGCPKQGRYGENCALSCPANCVDKLCHVVYGTCFGCQMGYKGAKCDIGRFL